MQGLCHLEPPSRPFQGCHVLSPPSGLDKGVLQPVHRSGREGAALEPGLKLRPLALGSTAPDLLGSAAPDLSGSMWRYAVLPTSPAYCISRLQCQPLPA